MNAEDFAKLIETKCLTAAGLEQAKTLVSLTAKDSPYLAEHTAALVAAQARWDAETVVRDARKALADAGWRKSDYGPEWVRRTKNGWEKKSLIDAIRAAGLAE